MDTSENKRPGYIAVLPAAVRYDPELPPMGKLIYAEISALSESCGYAWCSNDYLERLFGLSERQVIRLIKKLEAAGYIRIDGAGTTKRRIWINLNPRETQQWNEARERSRVPATDKNVSVTDKNVSATDKNVSATDKNVSAIYNVRVEQQKETNPPKPPRGQRGGSVPNWKPERFEAFWRFYPAIPDGNGHGRRPAKDRAARAWDKLKPDDALIKRMGQALQRQKQSRQWQDGVGIPYASTWLNGRAWEEETEELPGPKTPEKEKGEKIEWMN